jgi:hypothetical protein
VRKCRLPGSTPAYSRHHSIQIGVHHENDIPRRLALTLAAAAFTLPAHATQMTIDGNFADWGVANNGTVSGWTPGSGILFVDDQSNANNGYLNPGWGGQAYDAEALYLTW